MDPSLPLISKTHRRPILMPSSSFGQLASPNPLSPPATPNRSSASLRRRATSGEPTGPGDLVPGVPSSSSRPSSPMTPTSSSRPTMATPEPEKRSPVRALDKKGKGREVLSWAEGFDRALATMGGRDATMKLVQYFIRTFLYVARLRAARRGGFSNASTPSRLDRIQAIQGNLSFTRRAFYFCSFLGPSIKLARPPKSLASIVPDVLDVWSSLADDIWTLHKLGFVGRRIADPAAEWSNRLWLYAIVVGLSRLSVSTPALAHEIDALEAEAMTLGAGIEAERVFQAAILARRKRSVEVWKAVKYWLDMLFVSYDVFRLKPYKDVVQMLAGLCASVISVRNHVETQRIKALG